MHRVLVGGRDRRRPSEQRGVGTVGRPEHDWAASAGSRLSRKGLAGVRPMVMVSDGIVGHAPPSPRLVGQVVEAQLSSNVFPHGVPSRPIQHMTLRQRRSSDGDGCDHGPWPGTANRTAIRLPEGKPANVCAPDLPIRDNAGSGDRRAVVGAVRLRGRAPRLGGHGQLSGRVLAVAGRPAGRRPRRRPSLRLPSHRQRTSSRGLALGGRPTWKPARRRRSHRC